MLQISCCMVVGFSHLTSLYSVIGAALSSGSEAEDPTGETHIQLADHIESVAANSQMAVRYGIVVVCVCEHECGL